MSSTSLRHQLKERGSFDSLEQTSPGAHLQENLEDPTESLLDHVSSSGLKALANILETVRAGIDG